MIEELSASAYGGSWSSQYGYQTFNSPVVPGLTYTEYTEMTVMLLGRGSWNEDRTSLAFSASGNVLIYGVDFKYSVGWSYDGTTGQGGGWSGDGFQTGLSAFASANTVKTGLLDYAVRTNYKSARTASQFNNLRPTQQAWRTINTLGKGGAKYLNTFKVLGKATGIASAGLAINDAIQNPTTGNIIQAFATTGLAFVRINPVVGIGLGIMDATGASDYLFDQVGSAIDNW